MKLCSRILGRAISGLTAVQEKEKASAVVKGSLGEGGVCSLVL